MEYLTPEDPKPGCFYLLPKIHKENNPGRPIVSAIGHPTEKISEFIDFHLRPFVESLPSHIKDTTDYLKKMENLTIPENTTLVTIYVISLYTNIPQNCRMQKNMETTNSSRTSDRMFSGDVYTGSKKQTILLLTETTIFK